MPHKVAVQQDPAVIHQTLSAMESCVLSDTVDQVVAIKDIQSVETKLNSSKEKFGCAKKENKKKSKVSRVKNRESLMFPNYIDTSNQASPGKNSTKTNIKFRSSRLSIVSQPEITSLVQNDHVTHFKSELQTPHQNSVNNVDKLLGQDILNPSNNNAYSNTNNTNTAISYDEMLQPFIQRSFDDTID